MLTRNSGGHEQGRALAAVLFFAALAVLLTWRLVRATPGLEGARSANSMALSGAQRDAAPMRDDLDVDERATIELFKRASPAVVNITNLAVYRQGFRMTATEVPQGSGSGFLWDDRGNVVTNFHVIENGERFRVTLSDRTEWEATKVGGSPNHDLAVLRIKAPRDRLTALAVGTSSGLAVGQKVFAIGTPFGLDQTLTTGIISGLGREIRSVTDHKISDVIQTDAAINPGNSGGPLLDSAGKLIGINTAIVSPSGAYAGIGFAVPVDNVKRVIPQLIARGGLTRPGLGVTTATDYVSRRLGVKGVVVTEVPKDSPGRQAGLRSFMRYDDGSMEFDLIVSVDGKQVEKIEDLFDRLGEHMVGDTVALGVQRGSQQVELRVKLGAIQD
ncbi:MAG TPA: trypsin-like peptidase domain-containing protein [Planctomycetota bacterium]|nr:trypsin-like peptidase domain-containing protein [Planctomycetota bacterium]